MKNKAFDFSGWATKADLQCADGRTILKNAFKHQHGQTVPLVWQHLHNTPSNILGHAIIEDRDGDVYCNCRFNDTEAGKNAKALVEHGDITQLSIFANQIKEQAKKVMHGMIREVSLVLSGANPGALIDNICFEHSETGELITDETEAVIKTGLTFTITHGTVTEPEKLDDSEALLATLTAEQKKAVESMIAHAGGDLTHANDKTIQDVFDTLNEDQVKLVTYLIGVSLEEAGSAEHSSLNPNLEGDNNMKHNVFDQSQIDEKKNILTHSQLKAIVDDAKKTGSLKESFMAHMAEYGFDPIDVLFPDARNVRPGGPDTIKRDDSWVAGVLAETNHTPFSRIRTTTADLTQDEARARGYITGKRKKEEIIPLMKRITTPTTIYKKQKLDRDDVVDITDFEIVVWLKSEMRSMLNEELARAVLIGDGRDISDEDKINEQNIRPIAHDDVDFFIHEATVSHDKPIDDIIDEFIKSREFYRGTGTPTLYTTTGLLTEMLLIKDAVGRRIYKDVTELSSVLRVSKIVEVEVMNNATREFGSEIRKILGIVVNLKDYTIGADKGGSVNMFDDFDIDYNQYKYLIETRASGALTRPKSAIVMYQKPAA